MITMHALEQEVKTCVEALIDRPVLTAADDRALLEQVRRHAPVLQNAFARFTGWRLQAFPDFARLVKTPARAEASHRLAWARGRTDYVLLRARHAEGRLVSAGGDAFLLDVGRVEQEVAELQARFGANWGKTLREKPVRTLAAELVAEMEALGLLRGSGQPGQYLVLPTAARLSAHYGDDAETDDE